MDDMLKTTDRDKNTPHSVGGFMLSTLDYTFLQDAGIDFGLINNQK